jgi:integrase
MVNIKKETKTLADVLELVEGASLSPTHLRDMKSAIKRIAEMAGLVPAMAEATAPAVRAMLKAIRPAAHGVTQKTLANLTSRLGAALQLAGTIDPRRAGFALKDRAWGPLLKTVAEDKRLSCGLAAFANYCAGRTIAPHQVDDALLQQFHVWLENRTFCPKPKDVVRRVPHLWNEASQRIVSWPKMKLTILSFKSPQERLPWDALTKSFRADAEAYLAMRANPDLFDERPTAPKQPLAESTLRQQKEHLRLAVSVLVEAGVVAVEDIRSLADLVEPEGFKAVLRHYHQRAGGQPNAFVVCLATTLIQAAQYHVGATAEEVVRLKQIASKLPQVPHELTAKNKSFLRQFESDRLRAELLFLPERLLAEVTKGLAEGRVDFVKAQIAVAIEFQLAIPLRPQNLIRLNWGRHFLEPEGPRGPLLLHIPKAETKSGKNDFNVEVPEPATRRLRWYRRHILPRLTADPNGDLFVNRHGQRKSQETLTDQIIRTTERYLGVDMSPHQFRHLAGASYLEENPEDTETVRALLGHAWSKTTQIYVGTSSRRAGKAYNRFVFAQREALKLKRKRQWVRKPKKESEPCES